MEELLNPVKKLKEIETQEVPEHVLKAFGNKSSGNDVLQLAQARQHLAIELLSQLFLALWQNGISLSYEEWVKFKEAFNELVSPDCLSSRQIKEAFEFIDGKLTPK